LTVEITKAPQGSIARPIYPRASSRLANGGSFNSFISIATPRPLQTSELNAEKAEHHPDFTKLLLDFTPRRY
jgi:hypothetical protein